MAKYWKIKIGTVWLTSDGTQTGKVCRTEFAGADAILAPLAANTIVSADGTPFTETPLTLGKGRAFEISIQTMKQDVFEDLKTLIDAAISGNTDINITAGGDAGNLDLQAIPFFNPIPLAFSRFSNGFIDSVTLRFITTAIN